MLKAILWDFGGVITSSPFEAFSRYEETRGLPRDFIRGINATNPETNAWAQFESSAVSLDEFDDLFEVESRAAGHSIRGRDIVALLSGQIRPRMVSALEHCKQHYHVACITNNVNAGSGRGMAATSGNASAVETVMSKFDLVVESRLEGIRKPNPRIYEITCERLGVQPSESLFLDDLGINLKPARAMGMKTIKVLNEQQALDELAEHTGLKLASD